VSELFHVSSYEIDLPSAGAKTNELITKQAWYFLPELYEIGVTFVICN